MTTATATTPMETSRASQLQNLTQSPVVRQLGLMFGLAASVALGVAVVMWSQEPTYGVLYSGLANKDAAAVVDMLRQQGTPYKLDDVSGAIMVPADKVHQMRLDLANAGLPQSAGVGFNILERKQEFGTSQFMENARYQRALEEELARSIAALSSIDSARIHLAVPKQSVFVRKHQEPSASVLVNLFPGRTLEEEQVSAITHLVASSIPNMEPGQVTVVDQKGRLLSGKKTDPEMAANRNQFDHTRRLEDSYVARIESILGPIVGIDGVRAQVSADMDFNVTEQTQETYNPDMPALRSEQRYEQQSRGDNGGIPGALSNQPPASGSAPETLNANPAGAGDTQPVNSVKRATVNYELDRTISHTRLATGVVKRLSVAVVVDDKMGVDENGAPVRTARTSEEMERITTLVKEAVGYNPQRGDSVNVINASFANDGMEPLPEVPFWKEVWVWNLAKQILGFLIATVLVIMVLRMIMRSFQPSRAEAGGEALALEGPEGGEGLLTEDQLSLSGGTPNLHLPGPDQTYDENLNQARQMALQDPKRVAQVVRSWISSDDK